VAPSPFKGRSKIFTIASAALCTDAMDIVTRKEKRHFLPSEGGRKCRNFYDTYRVLNPKQVYSEAEKAIAL